MGAAATSKSNAGEKKKSKPGDEDYTPPKGIRSGVLLSLYSDAVERDLSYGEFLGLMVRKGGYKRTEVKSGAGTKVRTAAMAAQQRLHRFKKDIDARGLALTPLNGEPVLSSSANALTRAFPDCLGKK